MPKINRYVDISEVERESRKDYIDRHSPFIHCAETATAGEPFEVTVKVGNEYSHLMICHFMICDPFNGEIIGTCYLYTWC